MIDILIIIFIVILIFAGFKYLFQKKLPNNTVIAFTGGLGSGKTFLGVKYAIKHHKKMLLLYRLKIIKTLPEFYSNIPIRYKRKQWTKILDYDHLTLQSKIPEYSTIFIDELGQFASQYDFNNPFVMQYLQEFIRFYRHYTDGKLIITDQTSSNIVVAIRRRINQIYHLSDFKRYLFFFYYVNVEEIHITEDIVNIKNVSDDDIPYFFGYLPFKYLKFINYIISPFSFKKYDSRAYSINYTANYRIGVPIWSQYKTNYFIELPNNLAMKKQFQTNGYIDVDQMKQYTSQWLKDKNKDKELIT
jgi:hypothetical protein